MRKLTKLPAIFIMSIVLFLSSYSASIYAQEIKLSEKTRTYDYVAKSTKKKRPQRTKTRRGSVRRIPRIYKDPGTAALLSAVVPGSGQMYVGRPEKGIIFLTTEAVLFTVAGLAFNRAVYYDDQYDTCFRREFYDDKYSESWLTCEEGYDRARNNRALGTVFLVSGLSVHLWNILDATHTARKFNRRRAIALDIKSNSQGTYLAINKKF